MGLNYRRPTPKPPFAWQPSQEYEPYLKKSRGEGFLCVCVCAIGVFVVWDLMWERIFGGREARDSGNVLKIFLRRLGTS